MGRSTCGPRVSALVLAGVALAAALTARASAEDPWPDRQEVERFLKKARITEHRKIGEGVTKPEKVTLELDGTVRHAIFKRIDEPSDNWRSEVAAYELDKLLGLGMVPPTVARSLGGSAGCLQLWVAGTTVDKHEGPIPDIDSWRDQVSVMLLFDDLIANVDRHLHNAMISPSGRLMLIDSSRSFRDEAELQNDLDAKVVGTNAQFWGVPYDAARRRFPTRYPKPLVERLRTVSDKEIKDAVDDYVWGWRQKVLLDRRRRIVALLAVMPPETFRDDAR